VSRRTDAATRQVCSSNCKNGRHRAPTGTRTQTGRTMASILTSGFSRKIPRTVRRRPFGNSYRAWSHHRPVPADHGVVFIRSASAKPLVLHALDPQDGSNASSSTGTNVSVLMSPQLHTRKVVAQKTIRRCARRSLPEYRSIGYQDRIPDRRPSTAVRLGLADTMSRCLASAPKR